MTHLKDHIEPRFLSGADALLGMLKRLTDTVVVVSKGVRDGFSIGSESHGDSIQFYETADQAMSFAIGLAMTGRRTSVVLDCVSFNGVRAQLHSAFVRQLPLTVVLARNRESAFDPIEEFGNIGCPLLCASDAQSLIDLCVVAHAVSKTAMLPVLLSVRAQQCLWTYQQLTDSPFLGDIVPGNALQYYRTEILGENQGNKNQGNSAWIDTSNPMASGIAASGSVQVKGNLGRKIFIENELPALIDHVMELFGEASGRTYSAVQSSTDKAAASILVDAGTKGSTAEQRSSLSTLQKSGFATINITRVRPFPFEELQSHLSKVRAIGVLSEVNGVGGGASPFITDIQSTLPGSVTKKQSSIWNRDTNGEATHSFVVPVLHSPDWVPGAADFKAIAHHLSLPELKQEPVVVGVRLHNDDLRLPAVEELVQRMARSGIAFSDFEIRSTDNLSSNSSIYILSESIQALWPLMEEVCGLLSVEDAQNICGSLHPASMATSSPVIGCISFDSNTEVCPFVICSSPDLLQSRSVREVMPEHATVLTFADDGEIWPFWMIEKRLSLQFILPEDTSSDMLLRGALAMLHPVLNKASDSEIHIREAKPDEFEAADQSPPEISPPSELKDRSSASLPVANLLRFWKSLGHVYRTARISDAPVDAFLTSQFLPASTAPLLGMGQANTNIPNVITERCTGCGSCWTVCPESAFIVRPFSVEALWDSALTSASQSFVQLPRLAPAVLKTAHRLVKEDELHQYMTIGDLFIEAFERVLDKAGLQGDKRTAVEAERDALLAFISNIRPVRTESWFDQRESAVKGDGALLGIGVDPEACTSCGICLVTCEDDALDIVDSARSVQEWEQLAALQTLPGEDRPSEKFEHPAAILTGKTSRRVFREGGSDTANLNRTVLRLFLEAQNEHTSSIRMKVLKELEDMISNIDVRLQETLDESVRINDFDQFSRRLRDAGRDLFTGIDDLLNEQSSDLPKRLAVLAEYRAALVEEKLRLEVKSTESLRTHMVLVDATTHRSLGLAPYPSNPFSMPYFRAGTEDVANLVSGITRGFIDQYNNLARQLRISRQVLDDVWDPETTNEILPSDVQWAQSFLPHLTVVTDRIDFSTLRALEIGPHVRILVLSGAGQSMLSESGIDAGVLARLLDNVWLSKLTIHDPVKLLSEFSDGVSSTHPALFQVYAPDPVRDGMQPDIALVAADLAERSGVCVPFRKEPGKSSSSEDNRDDSVCAADWMILQNRFASQFEFIPHADWSSDQLCVAEWLKLSDEERKTVQPYVEHNGRRYRPAEEVLAFSLSVFSRRRKMPAQEETIAPEASKSASPQIEKPQPAPIQPDALGVLTRKLLALSGYEGSKKSLASWSASQDEVASE